MQTRFVATTTETRGRVVRAIARFGLLAALALLAGCGGRSEESLLVVERPAGGTPPVDMMVVTTRECVPDPGRLFNGERGNTIVNTELKVSIPPVERKPGEVIWPTHTPPDPAREFAVVDRRDHTPESARNWFRAQGTGRALIFVHGFNTRYDDAVFRFAQFVRDSGTTFTPVLFTWPSRGKLVAYNYDRESTNYSRDAFEALLTSAAADPSVKEISILAHSMGTWLTMETLRQMAIRDGRLPAKLHDVILASPDIDGDVFQRQLARIPQPRPRISLFVSRDDRALDVSRLIAGDVDRVGQIDPSVEPWKSMPTKENVHPFDLTATDSVDRLRHGRFADGDIARMIGLKLIAGQSISDQRIGLGERVGGMVSGTLGAVGSTAGAVVAAPLSVIDAGASR